MTNPIAFDAPLLVFGGVYSNLQALEALLAEAKRRGIGPSNMLCTGDIAAYCADARACVDLIRSLSIAAIAGNCEEQIAQDLADCGCGYAPGSACDTLSASWFAHAAAQMQDDQRAYMAGLPQQLEIALNGLRLAVVHGAPGATSRFVFPSTPTRVKLHAIEETGADGVIASHSGLPFSQVIEGRLWHNSGALGMPANDGTPRVWFSVLTPGRRPRSLHIEHVALDYDARLAARAMREARLPEPYAEALTSGLWPSCDSMPADEVKRTGKAIATGAIEWDAGEQRSIGWPVEGTAQGLAAQKFRDPFVTAKGEPRAHVSLQKLETLWLNTGTLCNLACVSCYIESSPRNDRLAYLSAAEASAFFHEIESGGMDTTTIGFTGGEPFMNPDVMDMLSETLERGYEALVLTNAMKPMRRFERELLALNARFRDRLTLRVSLDHYTKDLHELERGPRSWEPAIEGLQWLAQNGFRIAIAGRGYSGEAEGIVRAGYARLLEGLGIDLDVSNPAALVLFPEMDGSKDVPEITTACWSILGKSPADIMCASSRMVVKRKGAERPAVIACTLLPYDPQFELGTTLAEASRDVPLNHSYCAQFCVLGGAACKI